ncbi:myosin heavy chain, class XI [Ectocarpus siliculosus]|uniref:Myosin heavy chain, class XI n=1 Tax=Ectocarpus siliculosus TaxID=2880 RepID=D7FMX2_ECTSI|nr:myosin heavy chain, class XI [Ectocarpus siliculosus]|eukprot:CBJ30036.1 myosin heavy chain, class XI [Ectocarpus siliculosus]
MLKQGNKEQGPHQRDEALAEAREAYRRCAELEGPRGENIKVQAQVGLARLDFVVGDPASIRSALARLAEILRDHPYSQHIEEVIYFLAVPAAFPQTKQSTATATGALEYLDYLRDSYAPSREGAPTAMMYPRWDAPEQEVRDSERDGIVPGDAERWQGKGLQVHGLPAWALQFQIGLLASRLGNSTRGMETMENAFTSYEAWLPRSRGQFNDGAPDVDAIRRSWYNGLPHWTAWVQHPRTWLDLGDIAYRQGVGCFHVAAEAYRGALKRAGNLFPPDQQESIAYRIAKCCSRCGDLAGAVSGIEELLYTHNFWSERYRACARAVIARSARDFREAIVLAHASKLIRNFQVVCWKHWKQHHDMVRLDKAAAQIQALLRGTKARAVVRFILAARKSRDLLEQLVENMHDKCIARRVLRRLSKQVMVGRRERAATTIQAMARGVVGRETASDERNRQARINELLLNALRRLGTPVFREWYKAAHSLRRARMSIKIQSRWRTFRAMRALTLTKTKVSRAHEMGILAIGRNQLADKRRVVETWKHLVLERKVVAVQGMARIWLAKRVMSRGRVRQKELRRLFMRVTKPIRRQCFVALARNRTTCRKNKKALVLVIQCWWRCRHAIGTTRRAREYRKAIHGAYDTVVTNHERRLLTRCCREWRENIPKQKAATKIQAAWRGWEGRLRAAWFKDREVRFEEFAQVLRAVSRQAVRKVAIKEWRTLAWLSRMTTKLSARYRGIRARTAFAAKMSALRRQQAEANSNQVFHAGNDRDVYPGWHPEPCSAARHVLHQPGRLEGGSCSRTVPAAPEPVQSRPINSGEMMWSRGFNKKCFDDES